MKQARALRRSRIVAPRLVTAPERPVVRVVYDRHPDPEARRKLVVLLARLLDKDA